MNHNAKLFRHPRLATLMFVLSGMLIALGCAVASAQGDTSGGLNKEDALAIATDAYIYGYPLVTMEMTRRVLTNTVAPESKSAPMGQFANTRAYPTASDHEVTAPNADTLYTMAWLDVSKEPYILGIPDAHGRYYLVPMLDGWTTVFEDPGNVQPVRGRSSMRSPDPAGRAISLRASNSISLQPRSCGSSDASTARARRRITKQFTKCRIRCRWFRSVPTASPTRRRRARCIEAST